MQLWVTCSRVWVPLDPTALLQNCKLVCVRLEWRAHFFAVNIFFATGLGGWKIVVFSGVESDAWVQVGVRAEQRDTPKSVSHQVNLVIGVKELVTFVVEGGQ